MGTNDKQRDLLPLIGRRFVIDQTPLPTTDAARAYEIAERLKAHNTQSINYSNKAKGWNPFAQKKRPITTDDGAGTVE